MYVLIGICFFFVFLFVYFFYNRRKKKCIRYLEAEGEENNGDMDNHISDDNLGSCGSVDDAKTPEDDTESLNQSLSSPGCLSGLSSLQSPSTSLASPLNLLTSPSTPNTIHSSQEQLAQQQHQSIFAGDGSQQQLHRQHQQQISNNNNSSHAMNNSDQRIENNINSNNSNFANTSNIMDSTALNKHSLTSSLSSSITSLARTITSVPSSSTSPSSISSSNEIKCEKTISNSISPLLGVHLAAMGIGASNRILPQISTPSTIPPSSSSSLSFLPNNLLKGSMNKISNGKSQSNGAEPGSVGKIPNDSHQQPQSSTVSLKLN